MSKAQRQAAEWATLIDQWRQSGLSLPAFCQRHGLSRGTMQNWVYKPSLRHALEQARNQARPIDTPLPDSSKLPEPSPSFLPVRVAEAPQASPPPDRTGIELVLELGRRIAISPGFDAETLRRVLRRSRGPAVLSISSSLRIFLAVEPADMRKGFDGLSRLVRDRIAQDPLSGHLFVFRNRRR